MYPPQKQSRSWIPWAIAGGCGCLLLIGALVLAIPIFMGVKAATAGPEAVAKEFLAAGGRGDAAAAYAYFSEPLKQAQSYEEFAHGVSNNPHLFQVADTSYTNRSVNLDGAELAGTATLTNGAEVPVSFSFVKEADSWKLLGYNIGTP
jgi:hypothetical protein